MNRAGARVNAAGWAAITETHRAGGIPRLSTIDVDKSVGTSASMEANTSILLDEPLVA
jgi:hypothetical protein